MTDLRSRLSLAVGVLSLIVFVPGERPSNDPRFISPAAPVNAFWQAILDGEQGVLIPDSNVKHLMLRQDVVQA